MKKERKPNNYWDEKKCFEAAQNCKNIAELKRLYGSAYNNAKNNGWLSDYTWFKKNHVWNYENCLKIAKTCSSREEFSNKGGRGYMVALKNRWIDEWEWLNPKTKRNFYTKDVCFELAKQFDNYSDFRDKYSRAYEVCRKNEWLSEFTWFVRKQTPNGTWNYNSCREESKQYKTRTEFHHKNGSAYNVARKNGWLKDYVWLEEKHHPRGYWTREKCYEVALLCACCSEMNKRNGTAYNKARENGWLKDYVWFTSPVFGSIDSESKCHLIYVYEDVENKVCYVGRTKKLKERHAGHNRMNKGKYDGVKTYFLGIGKNLPQPIILEKDLTAEESQIREDFWKNEYKKNGWFTLNKAKTGKGTGALGGGFVKWTYETCYNEALKCDSLVRFQESSASAYNVARENDWLQDYVWFTRPRNWNEKWNHETCFEEAKKYASSGEFWDKMPGCAKVASINGWLSEYTWFKNPNEKPVNQYTVEGMLICQYPSIAKAAKAVNKDAGNLSRCVSGKQKTCGGFVWRYAE